MVRTFGNATDGKNYMTGITQSPDVFEGIDLSTLDVFLITPHNMLLLMQSKDAAGYDAFFKKNYMKP